MRDPINDLRKYREFLSSIPLDKYRHQFREIKWVEQDLPEPILPLKSIYKYYWEERKFLDFDKWFDDFWSEINTEPESKKALEEFKRYYFDKLLDQNGWFKEGFKARMYRTWVSVLTQIDFYFMFEYVCVKEGKKLQVVANAELDIKGIDARVGEIGFQIAKISQRKEARTVGKKKAVITIPYAVFNIEEMKRKMKSPRVKDKKGYKKSLESFFKYFEYLKNGFVVFNEYYMKKIIDSIDDFEKVSKAVEKISKDLSGES